MDFFSFARNLSNKYRKQLLDTGLDTLKTSSKKVVCKSAEAMGEFIGNKVADAVVKSKNSNIVKQKPLLDEIARNDEEIIIPPENREEILNE